MKRREFLTAAVALAALPMAARAGEVAFTDAALTAELAAGKTVVLHFSATWCTTCQVQIRALDGLRAANPAYDAGLTFMRVDWDTNKGGPLTQRLNVPERSTFVAVRGDAVIGRVDGATDAKVIAALLDQALLASA
jgi:thioredoxin 1